MHIFREFSKKLEARLSEKLNFIQVVTGPRQVGKTTGLRQIAERWQGPCHLVSADEVVPPSADWIELNWRIARGMGEGVLLVIDEIQKVPRWSERVKRLFDEDRAGRRMKVVLLGSASLLMQRGMAESLAGRFEVIHAGHWSLGECREAFGWGLGEFLKFGGYPAAAELSGDFQRWRDFINHSVIEPVLLRDLLSLAAVNKPALFRQTFQLCLAYPAMEVSLQKLLGQLQESGNVTTIKHYLELFEGAYLVKGLQKYSGSELKKRGSSPKILPLNTALVNARREGFPQDMDRDWMGRLFECAVGAELCRRFDEVMYWREGGAEVDFVVKSEGRVLGIEVKSGRVKKPEGLARFCQRYPDAVPMVLDLKKGELLLSGATLDGLIREAR